VGKTAPVFTVASLEKDSISSANFLGKVTLLDFWEVWCGPCLASLPKVEQLAKKYASKGLQVYGITHETNQLDIARKVLQKRGISFRTLVGNDQLREAYKLEAIPLYVLINQQGNIVLVREGFTSDIEATIQTLLDS
jgi:thiol-disulfide isomerase/thioredoxin